MFDILNTGNKSKDEKSNRYETLNAGRHRLPFAFVLPEEGLPSSVKAGSTFTINYQITSTIVFPHRPPFTVHRPFFIFEVVDVNLPRYVVSYHDINIILIYNCSTDELIKIDVNCCLYLETIIN